MGALRGQTEVNIRERAGRRKQTTVDMSIKLNPSERPLDHRRGVKMRRQPPDSYPRTV